MVKMAKNVGFNIRFHPFGVCVFIEEKRKNWMHSFRESNELGIGIYCPFYQIATDWRENGNFAIFYRHFSKGEHLFALLQGVGCSFHLISNRDRDIDWWVGGSFGTNKTRKPLGIDVSFLHFFCKLFFFYLKFF